TVAHTPLPGDCTSTICPSGPSPVDSGAGLKADTWTLSETPLAGYTASDWVCVGGTYNKTGGGVETIQLGLGGSATCTITNDDNAPALHLRKVVVNSSEGQATELHSPGQA